MSMRPPTGPTPPLCTCPVFGAHYKHLWGECSRLLTNCIIAYNATILSHLLAHKERSGDASGAARLIRVSPVAWQHINLYGRYEFRKAPETIDLPALIQELDQIPVQPDLAV
jgi:Tn3 transposase DDE domain